jgi:hypothetical protein
MKSAAAPPTYPEALQFLAGLQQFGARPGLETTRHLTAALGQPHEQLRFIHVAGTNGKGSTCALLESAYRAAGYRVGLFTSPHLVSFRERIQINRTLIPAAAVANGIAKIRATLPASLPTPPTLFEITTLLALDYFAAHRCDVVIWETGLGGAPGCHQHRHPAGQRHHQHWLGSSSVVGPHAHRHCRGKKPASSNRACQFSPARISPKLSLSSPPPPPGAPPR